MKKDKIAKLKWKKKDKFHIGNIPSFVIKESRIKFI